jgi:hypothetical protein
MMPMPLDLERLTKLMAMTTSDKDPEALAAVRMANKMLSGLKMTWGDVLKVVPPEVKMTIFAQTQHEANWDEPAYLSDKVQIDLMFKSIYSAPRTGVEDFWRVVDGIHQSYVTHGRLTAAQYKIIRHCYSRTLRHA